MRRIFLDFPGTNGGMNRFLPCFYELPLVALPCRDDVSAPIWVSLSCRSGRDALKHPLGRMRTGKRAEGITGHLAVL